MSPVNRVPFGNADHTLASAARTTTGTSTAFDTGDLISLLAALDITAASGTTPTLDVKLQTSFDGGSTWVDVASFAQATNASGDQTKLFSGVGPSCRWSWTIAGTTPSFTFSIASKFNRDD